MVGWLLVFSVHAVTVIAFATNHTLISGEDTYINLAKNLVQHGSYHLDYGAFGHVSGQPYTYIATRMAIPPVDWVCSGRTDWVLGNHVASLVFE